ncbi:MAG: peptide ABC transporter substrate-binding protein [Brevefilum sp.]
MKNKLYKSLLLIVALIMVFTAGCQPTDVVEPTDAAVEETDEAPVEEETEAPADDDDVTEEPTEAVQEPSVLRQPANEPSGLDPALGGYGYQEYVSLYEPLVDSFSPSGEITPLAAENFTVSDDVLVYTFVLREGLLWSDGTPLTAEDFRLSWLRQLAPETASYSPHEFYPIVNAQAYNAGEITDPNEVGITAVDERTLVVELEQATPHFLYYVGNTNFVPVRVDLIEEYGDQWMEAGNFVGNGPYMLTQWDHDQLLVLEPNPYYNGIWKDYVKVDRIEYVLMADAWNQAVPSFETGEVDVAIVPASELSRLQEDPEYSDMLTNVSISGSQVLIIDTKNPPTDDVRVRQALSLAIDRLTLADAVLRGAYAPADSLSPPDLASYNPDEAFGYQYNPELAAELLAEAGYPDGEGFPPFEVAYWSVDLASLVMQTIQAMWKQNLGIDVTLNPIEPAAMRDWRISRNETPFNMYYGLNWCGIPDASEFHNALFDPSNSLKRSRYDNPEYIDLILNAFTEMDTETRNQMYKDAEAIVNEEVPIISLFYESQTWLVRPEVKNFKEITSAVASMFRYAQPPGLEIE